MNERLALTVIVPTYNRSDRISSLLLSLEAQSLPKDLFEIIVVDNNSTDNTKVVIEQWKNTNSSQIKYLFEPRQGVHYARNRAATMAAGKFLYFTDDDIELSANALESLLDLAHRSTQIGSVTGPVLPKWEVPPPDWVLKYLNNFLLSLNDLGRENKVTKDDPGVFSCHQLIRREVFFKTEGFHPENTAGDWLGDGETGLNISLKKAGYLFGYVGKALAFHTITADRMTQAYLDKRLANQGSCDAYTGFREHRFDETTLFNRQAEFIKLKQLLWAQYKERLLQNDTRWRLSRGQYCRVSAMAAYELRLTYDPRWRDLVLKSDWLRDELKNNNC